MCYDMPYFNLCSTKTSFFTLEKILPKIIFYYSIKMGWGFVSRIHVQIVMYILNFKKIQLEFKNKFSS